MSQCVGCGAPLQNDEMTCEDCGRRLAGTRRVAEVPLEEEAILLGELLESAGFRPILAWIDDGGRPRPIKPGSLASKAMGLLPPVTTPFAVYVPEEEADEAISVLQDAGKRRSGDDLGAS